MNIFVLHGDPRLCARYHSDVHVVSQLKEGAQIMSTACHLLGLWHDRLYRVSHPGHPCCKWAAESVCNMEWLLELVFSLNREYVLRRQFRGKEQVDHKSLDFAVAAWDTVSAQKNADHVPDKGLTRWVQALPERYREPYGKSKARFGAQGHPSITAYRRYYKAEKGVLRNSQGKPVKAKWTSVGPPPWWSDDPETFPEEGLFEPEPF